MQRLELPKRGSWPLHYFALILLVVLTFMMGGASRADVLSLAILRPAAAILLIFGLYGLTYEMTRGFRLICGLAVALVALIGIQLIPLPPGVWTNLPGRGVMAEGMLAVGLQPNWQPITMLPWLTWNAFYALLVPLAALVLMLRCTPTQRASMLTVLIIAAIVSAVIGFVQAASPGVLQFYRLTNDGFPVGLFANRNHQAVWLCCLPLMLAGWSTFRGANGAASQVPMRLGALILVIALIPLVLITGSRAGLILYVLSLVMSAAILVGASNGSVLPWKNRRAMTLLAGLAIMTLLLVIAMASRDVAGARLMGTSFQDELRAVVWPRSINLAWAYFPSGIGYGAFPEVFKIGELQNTLGTSYVNHAHSDWIEFILDGGIVAVGILLTAIIAWGRVMIGLLRHGRPHSPGISLGLTAGAMMIILALASAADYPLRVPSLMVVGVIAVLWFAESRTLTTKRND